MNNIQIVIGGKELTFSVKFEQDPDAGAPWDNSEGHDFWLTRAGHGAGFWDGDLPEELGERLTQASKAAGNREPYIGDDGLIYQ